MRLDQYLVEIEKCRSRTQAKELIQSGKVCVDGRLVIKPSYACATDCKIEISDEKTLAWVSRSGEKLDGALRKLSLNLSGLTCLDVGQSTGGFTQAMLKRGAVSVLGVDVGVGQLSEELKGLPNVHCLESFDARDLGKLKDEWRIDFFAVDVSFISVLKVFEGIRDLVVGAEAGVKGVLLIKPQFEVGKKNVKKGGLVTDPLVHLGCEKQILSSFSEMGVQVLDYFPSSLRGRDGNQEFICYISL